MSEERMEKTIAGLCPNCKEHIAFRVEFARQGPLRSHRIDWGKVDPLLGTKTDGELAREFGVAICTIAMRRRSFQIPSHTKAAELALTKQIEELVGKVPDSHLAMQFSVPSYIVRRIRERLGVPKMAKKTEEMIERKARIEKLRGEGLSMEEIARIYRVSKQRIEQILVKS